MLVLIHELRTARDVRGLVSLLSRERAETSAEALTAAIAALGVLGHREASPALTAYLSHEEPDVRAVASGALREIADPATIPALIEALKDSHPNVVWCSADALGKMRATEATDSLVELSTHGDWRVRRSAKEAMKRIEKVGRGVRQRRSRDESFWWHKINESVRRVRNRVGLRT